MTKSCAEVPWSVGGGSWDWEVDMRDNGEMVGQRWGVIWSDFTHCDPVLDVSGNEDVVWPSLASSGIGDCGSGRGKSHFHVIFCQ